MNQTHNTTNVHVTSPVQQYPFGTKYDPRIGSVPFLWCFLFGIFYLMYKGLWMHVLIYLLLCWTFIVPIIYCFKARDLVYNNMKAKGLLN